jgi:acyl-CoA synthetase (NDP forming)/GNAT superfamily N-acetyltransferase
MTAVHVRPRPSVDVTLRDGGTVLVRRAGFADAPAVGEFIEGLSVESRWFRFFTAGVDGDRIAREAVRPGDDHVALVAQTGQEPRIVGLAQLERTAPGRGEVAFAVADAFQGRGLGTILLAHLIEHAPELDVDVLEAQVLRDNAAMARVLDDSGLPFRTRRERSTVVFEAPAGLSAGALDRFEERERLAAANAVAHVLRPASVAVVGASRRGEGVGSEVLANLQAFGYTGALHVVNRHGGVIQGVPAAQSLSDIGEPVELIVVAVPAPQVAGVAAEAAAIGARALVVLTADFAETGEEGRRLQDQLLAICRQGGMRLLGPNCLGVVNTDPQVRLDATFGAVRAPRGRVAMMSQSGALGLALLGRAADRGIGISSFVSAGNKADLSGNDFLEFWEQDDQTDVVLLYLESFGNPRNFGRIARRVTRAKPIVAVKSGRSAVGARAAQSHTGALLAASDATVDALFRQAGVIRADTLEELLDVATLLGRQPVPRGPRVAVVTNAGGPGILCADACVASGLEVPEPPPAERARLAAGLPAGASTGNPIDMIASAGADAYAHTVETVVRGGWADAVVAIVVEVAGRRPRDLRMAVERAAAVVPDAPPVVTVMLAGETRDGYAPPVLPTYDFPEQAARALAHAVGYGRLRAAPAPEAPELPDVRSEEVAALLRAATARGPRWLAPGEVADLCGCWGIRLVASLPAGDPDAAGDAAAALGGAVVLKAHGPDLLHKTDVGAVRVGLRGRKQVRAAAVKMRDALAAAGLTMDGFAVQPLVDTAVELLVGVVQDPRFGPVVACGAGGVRAELERDVAVRLAPVGVAEAREAIRSLRTFPLLDGWRGAPRADTAALEDLVVRTAAMADAHEEVLEVDFNPVVVSPEGALVLDARVRVGPAPAPSPWPAIGAMPPPPSPAREPV